MADDPDHTAEAKAAKALAQQQPAWDDLRIFLAVAVHGSLSRAAQGLGQSQSTIGRRIRVLEEQLQLRLLDRTSNGTGLTQEARVFLEALSPADEQITRAIALAASLRPDQPGPVRITATTSVSLFLSGHMDSLLKASGPIGVTLLPTRRKLDLLAGEADIALRMEGFPTHGDLMVKRIGQMMFGFYGLKGKPVKGVIAPTRAPSLSVQAAMVETFRGKLPILARIDELALRHHAIRAGGGAGMLPCWTGDVDPALERLSPTSDDMVEDIYLICPTRLRGRKAISRVIDQLGKIFVSESPVLMGKTN